MKTSTRIVAMLVAVIAAVMLNGVQPAQAAAPSVQGQINAQLAAYPGGIQINATEVSYGGGRFVITFARSGGATTLATADCPSGWYCFYDGVNYTYPRGRLSDCGYQDLGTWGWRNRVDSAYYNLSRGSTAFVENSGLVLFVVSTVVRGLPKVAYPNQADYVMRTC